MSVVEAALGALGGIAVAMLVFTVAKRVRRTWTLFAVTLVAAIPVVMGIVLFVPDGSQEAAVIAAVITTVLLNFTWPRDPTVKDV